MSEQCPECESTEVSIHSAFPHYVQYGVGEQATICYEAPSMECRKCGLMYEGEAGERAAEEAVARYRRVFSGQV